MKKERIGPKIKKLRKSRALTQKQLADALGYSDKSMITHIEKGDSDMTYEKIRFDELDENFFFKSTNGYHIPYLDMINKDLGMRED